MLRGLRRTLIEGTSSSRRRRYGERVVEAAVVDDQHFVVATDAVEERHELAQSLFEVARRRYNSQPPATGG